MVHDLRSLLLSLGDAAATAPVAPAVAAEDADSIRSVAASFCDQIHSARATEVEPCALPILDHLGPAGTDLGASLRDLAPSLPWRVSPRGHDPVGTNTALVVLDELFELDSLSGGFMALAPGAQYPVHEHPPHELYLVIDGTASWRYGGSTTYVELAPGTTLYNHPGDLHSALAGDDALLAMYRRWEGDPT